MKFGHQTKENNFEIGIAARVRKFGRTASGKTDARAIERIHKTDGFRTVDIDAVMTWLETRVSDTNIRVSTPSGFRAKFKELLADYQRSINPLPVCAVGLRILDNIADMNLPIEDSKIPGVVMQSLTAYIEWTETLIGEWDAGVLDSSKAVRISDQTSEILRPPAEFISRWFRIIDSHWWGTSTMRADWFIWDPEHIKWKEAIRKMGLSRGWKSLMERYENSKK